MTATDPREAARTKEKPTANGGRPLAGDVTRVAREAAPVKVERLELETVMGEPNYAAGCRLCGQWVAQPRYTWQAAMDDALHHRCDGVRLRALLAGLEGLRDYWRAYADVEERKPIGNESYTRGRVCVGRNCADNLDALIREASC